MMNGTLIIRPINGNLTRNTDILRKMDPYVRVILGVQHRQTSVARKAGKHPAWRDELSIKRTTHDDVLNFEVWDEDTNKKDDFVGSGALAIATIQQKGNRTQEWVQLTYKGRDAGQILVDITFIPDKGINMMQNMPNTMPNTIPMMTGQMTQPMNQVGYPNSMQNQGGYVQQIPQQTHYQQPNLVQQNTYPNQCQMPQQGLTQQQQQFIPQQQSYPQQGYPQQTQLQGQQIPIQQTYPQQQMVQQPIHKVDNFAPPIEQANTLNRNQMRVGTQINQGDMYYQGNPNPYGHHYPH